MSSIRLGKPVENVTCLDRVKQDIRFTDKWNERPLSERLERVVQTAFPIAYRRVGQAPERRVVPASCVNADPCPACRASP
jgi:hypothetical protein